jgi:peroxiredoxin
LPSFEAKRKAIIKIFLFKQTFYLVYRLLVQSKTIKKKILIMALNVGEQAPDFKLFNTDKAEINLADYRGKNVVVLFFPLAFTGVCTAELCQMRDDIATYSGLNAEILGISVDSIFTLGKFKEEQNLPFNLLSDFNKEIAQSYGSYYDTFVFGMKGVAKRAAFVVDATGVIRYAEVLESAGDLPNFDAVKATLESL